MEDEKVEWLVEITKNVIAMGNCFLLFFFFQSKPTVILLLLASI